MTPEKKLEIAKKLDDLGVDVIEAGFASVSEGEKKAIKLIVAENLKAEICSFARGVKKDIDDVIESGANSVFLVVPASDIHIKNKLKKTRDYVLKITKECVKYAKDNNLIVEFGPEDASRSNINFLKELISTSISAGADRVTPPDTVGILTPEKTYSFFRNLKETFPDVSLGVHCHNDFGLAVANSLAALKAGVEEIHVTVNGLGERAGNAALEEAMISLKLQYNKDTGIHTNLLYDTSILVSRITGIPIQPNKAIVGENAFVHESGIHTHAILAEPQTYEAIQPKIVGRTRRLVAGKHAGAHGIKAALKDMSLNPSDNQLKRIFSRVKAIGDKGKRVTDADLKAIADSVMNLPKNQPINLEELTVVKVRI